MSTLSSSELNEQPDKEQSGRLRHAPILDMIWCLGLALFWVIFLWRFWEKGVFALGINASIFFILLLALFMRRLHSEKYYHKQDLYWTIPLILIAFSFLFYANPFLKIINLFVYPLLAALFINYGFLRGKAERYWGANFIFRMIARFFSFFRRLGSALNHYLDILSLRGGQGRGMTRRIVTGAILLLLVALTVVIPLLSSADPIFGDKLAFVYDLIRRYIAESVIYKIVFIFVFTPFLFSVLLAWTKDFDYQENEAAARQNDPIVAGIILGGILALYLLFLWVQVERLWVGSLPFEFRETEALVKSGFWQLFFLTGLNTILYFFTNRKTGALVQKMLTVFTAASLLLLVSAGQRVALYVINYGFSYEKFFAAYTVVYCAILFLWLFVGLFRTRRADIFKFIVFLFLWMYALITVSPVEQIIFRSNIALAERPDSRIRLYELTMLSTDVLALAKSYRDSGLLKEDWQPWIERQEKRLSEKRWYEFNF